MGRIDDVGVGVSLSGLIRQVATVLFGRVVIRIVQFIAFLLLARLLSPTDFGWFGILTTTFVLAATLGSLGLRQSFAFEIGQGRLTPGKAVGTALTVWPIVTILSAAVIFVVYGNSVDGVPPSLAAIIIVAGVAGATLHTLMQGVFLGRGTIWAFSLSESLPRVFLMVGVVLLALGASLSLQNALWAHVAAFLIPLVLIVYLARRESDGVGVTFARLRPMLSYGLIFAFNLFLITLCSRLAMLIIEAQVGVAEAGQFFAAVRVNEIFLEAAAAVGMVLFSRATRSADSASSIAIGAAAASWLFWFFILLAGVIAISAPTIVTVLLGEEYAEAAPALQILALGLAPAAASKIIYPAIAGTGRPLIGTPVIVTALLLNAITAILLVPNYGVSGGAIAVVVGQYIMFAGYGLACRIRFGLPMYALLVPRMRGTDARKRLSEGRPAIHGDEP